MMTNIFHAGLEQDRYITPRVYVLGSMAFDHNYAQGLNLQQVYGGGIGWTVDQGRGAGAGSEGRSCSMCGRASRTLE